jgi:hypothetical protein
MTASTKTAPVARVTLNARETVELKDRMREDGWLPLESSTDWRTTRVGREHDGQTRTIAYVPEFRSVLGGARGWWKSGDALAPNEAAYIERYVVSCGPQGPGHWRPA